MGREERSEGGGAGHGRRSGRGTGRTLPGLLTGAALAAALVLGPAGCGGAGGPPETTNAEAGAFANESLDAVLQYADRTYREGDFVEAQAAFEEIRRREPDRPGIVAPLATCYLKNRANRKADELLAQWLARNPGETEARLVQARVFLRQGDYARAEDSLRLVLQAHPEDLVARYNLGFTAYRARRYDEAETHLREAIRLKPDLPEAHYTLGLTAMAAGRIEQAIAALEKAVALNPKHVGARFNLASAYARAGRMADAERQQAAYSELSGRSKAEQERETQIRTSSLEAIRLIQEKRFEEALAAYQTLVRRYPDHAPLYNEVGGLQVRLGRKEEAIGTLRQAAEIDPTLSAPHYLLSGLYREMGDAAAAARELELFATLETIPEGKTGY